MLKVNTPGLKHDRIWLWGIGIYLLVVGITEIQLAAFYLGIPGVRLYHAPDLPLSAGKAISWFYLNLWTPEMITLTYLAMIASGAWLLTGRHPRAALTLALICRVLLHNRAPGAATPESPLFNWILLSRILAPAVTDATWKMRRDLYLGGFLLTAVTYTHAGFMKAQGFDITNSWVNGSALWHVFENQLSTRAWAHGVTSWVPYEVFWTLSRTVILAECFALLFFPFYNLRQVWNLALLIVQIGILCTLDIEDITMAMILVHIWLIDLTWGPFPFVVRALEGLQSRFGRLRKWQYTSGNHLKTGWIRASNLPPLNAVMIGNCTREPRSGIEESIIAARAIRKEFGKSIVLCMSSGIDSENMAHAFLQAGVRFEVAIARYMPGAMNEVDISQAVEFCRKNKIQFHIIDIDLNDLFLSGKYLEYAEKYECRSPQLITHMRLLDLIFERGLGVPVLGWNPSEIAFDDGTQRPVILIPQEPYLSYLRFFARNQRPGVPFFFAYTPEQVYSFWRTPQFVKDLEAFHARFKDPKSASTLSEAQRGYIFGEEKWVYFSKVEKFRQAGFPAVARDKKRTGFEEVRIFFNDYFAARGEASPDPAHDSFNWHFRKPLEERWPYPPKAQIIPPTHFPRPDILEQWRLGVGS